MYAKKKKMSYCDWINLLRNAEKSSTIQGSSRKIHYKFPDGSEMAEEYSMETGVCLRRAWKKKHELRGDPQWETEMGEPIRTGEEVVKSADPSYVVKESSSEPILSKRLTKKNIEIRIRNLPYPIDTYNVTADQEKKLIIVRTTNKKYFKQIRIPELDRCGLDPEQDNITIHHQYNTLIITYKKPSILLEMERDVLLLLKDVETETDLEVDCNELLSQLMG